jgi:hypothetical protein
MSTPGTVSGQSDAPSKSTAPSSLYPTYALRAWLTALLAQTQKAQSEARETIRIREAEIARLREQIDRSGDVVKSLQDALERVDNVLRHKRDVQINREIEARSHVEEPRAAEVQTHSELHGREGEKTSGGEARAKTEHSESSPQTEQHSTGGKKK